jgi:regulatory protein
VAVAPEPDSPVARARAIALRALAARARTEAQVRARLSRAGLDAAADEVVAWLLGLGYLDDAAYAGARARSLVAPGRLGPRLAERRLVAEGVSPGEAREAVAAALAEAGGGADGGAAEVALCRALAQRRAPGADLAALDERARARLARFLLGRGFAGPVVARVIGLCADADRES